MFKGEKTSNADYDRGNNVLAMFVTELFGIIITCSTRCDKQRRLTKN